MIIAYDGRCHINAISGGADVGISLREAQAMIERCPGPASLISATTRITVRRTDNAHLPGIVA
jgi:hypothetical protein